MTITCILSKISRKTNVIHSFKKHAQNLPSFITTSKHQQPWVITRWYATATPERVKVTTREVIKPFSPTPVDKKTVQFSLLDQLAPFIDNCILLFYQNDPNNPITNNIEQKSSILKQSLSKTLVDYYPLAGKIKQNELIECNDQGVDFIQAHYSFLNLVDFTDSPNLDDLKVLLPASHTTPKNNNVMTVQLNHFSCGGIAIGVRISHKITDGCALNDFLNSWAYNAAFLNKNTNKNTNTILPKFNASSLFPPLKDLNDKIFNPAEKFSEETIVTRRLIFDKKTIDKLKADEVIKTGIVRPTTNEVIVGFIWKRLQPKFSSVLQFVNLRKKMVPAIPEESLGNFVHFTRTTIESNSDLAVKELLRNSIAKVNHDYIEDIYLKDASLSKFKEEAKEVHINRENCLFFSSISKLGLYQVDFGMGKPVWACLPCASHKNLVLIKPTKCGGLEAWISMVEDDIAMLDHSLSKLGYSVVNPLNIKCY